MRRLAAAFAVALLTAGAARAQTLETIRISTDPFGSNVVGTHATEVEPSADSFGSTIVSTFQVGRNFGGGAAAIGFATSRDGGVRWRFGLLPGLTVSAPQPGEFAVASDPVVAYDALHARWLAVSLAIRSDAAAVTVNTSADGLSWTQPVTAFRGPALSIDKEWVTCDNWPSSPFRGRCYIAYAYFARGQFAGTPVFAIQTSTDGGATWGAQVLVPVLFGEQREALSAAPFVRPDGRLEVAFLGDFAVKTIASTDGGASFAPAQTITALSSNRLSFRTSTLRAPNLPTAAVDAAGTAYVAWYDCRFRPGCSANDIVLARSPSAGVWTAVEHVRLPGSAATEFLVPSLAASRSTAGSLALAYYTLSAHDCSGAGCLLTAGLATSGDGGRTWAASPVGASMSLDWIAPTSLGRMVGDYFAAVLVPGRAIGIFSLARPPAGDRFDQAIHAAALPSFRRPRNARRPAIAGRARVGETLTCRRGAWTGTQPLSFSYAWLRNGSAVARATTQRYRVSAADAGALLRCRVQATNAVGTVRATSVPVRPARLTG